jgi:hypothetical protein
MTLKEAALGNENLPHAKEKLPCFVSALAFSPDGGWRNIAIALI